jgi:hypothetical protein
MTADLVAFLNARLDEDEQVAQAALGVNEMANARRGRPVARWESRDDGSIWDTSDTPAIRVRFTWRREAAHIARWDPARVLAEVDAKRRILAAYTGWVDRNAGPSLADSVDAGQEYGLEEAVRYLTLPYADHPDYRSEWAPDA